MLETTGPLPAVFAAEMPTVTAADLRDGLVALAILAGAIVLARITVAALSTVTRRAARAAGDTALGELLDVVAGSLRAPTALLIGLQGLFIGLHVMVALQPYAAAVNRFWLAAVLLTVAWGAHRIVMAWFVWYVQRQERTGTARIELATLGRIRAAISVTIVILGALIALDTLGLQVEPLLAGLGIGGLAVALALQPVLSNVFASSYLLSDGSIRVGDWVEIQNGPAGLVRAIGFRATRIATFDNNVVLVPNSTLATTTFTNFSATNRAADARVEVGVAYEESLQRVEDVLTDELRALRDEFAASVHDYGPIVLFQGFGDSNIDILLKLRAQTWLDSFALRHEMVKRVHARLAREGITINYPARRLMLQEQDTDGLARLAGVGAGTHGAGGQPDGDREPETGA